MQIYFHNYPPKKPRAVALGTFDGVHVGHKTLFSELLKSEYSTLAYTFDRHPVNVLFGEGTLKTVNTNPEKEKLISELGVDELLFDDFERIKDLTPEEFVRDILVHKLSAKEVVCGYNYRFGKDNSGDTKILGELLSKFGSKLKVVEKVTYNDIPVSSSFIRNALEKGDMPLARAFLGRPHHYISKVVHGKQLGRKMGFPTLNETLDPTRVTVPFGVYFAKVTLEDGRSLSSVVNIGIRPTVNFSGEAPTLEAHVIDFNEDIYGKEIKVELFEKHRDEIKFDSIDSLQEQIKNDVSACLEYFKRGENK